MKRTIEPLARVGETLTPVAAPIAAWPLAPMLAGARARGVADAFEWLGLAAILLDERGEVLHLSAGAVELMEDDLFRDGSCLRAQDRLADLRLRIAISAALRGGDGEDLVLPTRGGQDELVLRVAPIGAGLGEDSCQLLRVVIVIDRVAAPRQRRN